MLHFLPAVVLMAPGAATALRPCAAPLMSGGRPVAGARRRHLH